MFRLYCGNLDSRVTEETLQDLFEENSLSVTNIVVKRGYAFVDCPDQTILDKSIDKLNGYNLMGSVMQVEPSTMSKRRRSNRIVIRNLPEHAGQEDIQHLVATFGTVQRCDLVTGAMENSVNVTYETPDQAQQAVEQLNGYDYHQTVLKAEFMNNNNGRRLNQGARGPLRNSGTGTRGSGYPLRILVPSDFVGAIIGRKGQTIRNITTQCKARVDVHGKENSGLLEKVISIYGQPENCTNACKEILLVMQQEASANNRGDVTLKMLADDRYCGRIIGKEGKVIKKIREDTDTKITVSNVQEVAAMYPDRVITIRGSIDNMSLAEAAISTKLRECYEKEMQAPMPNMMMGAPMSGLPMVPSGGLYGMRAPYGVMQSVQPPTETCQISVPNSAVGAIIGAGGSNIKQIIRDSNAFVTIEPKRDDDPNPAVERIVTIKGNPDAIWRASFFVFEKLKQEGFAGNEDVRLRTAMKVPKSMVGRVIGKGGKNVRDIQRMTGAVIKLPEDQSVQGEEVMVEVYGTFMATQSAHSRIRALVQQGQQALLGPSQLRRGERVDRGERQPRNAAQN
ncbi:hypothetical protein LSH36_161g14031 [Paralvinella palmiformis]|uniref:RRM domain-containing protein n=1 Tax=Paralvinella palmiformis TaxID=53620 RepID=A0AAD9JTP6_9ANNE|nr:hypothetical protein LSH36_161g14031 [Paralvinella palmiformis]